ncbi:MAG: hydrolase [Mucilaginibacter sp.]|nr:hydrolase [Mucilaginibacter sp.]
MKKQTNKIGRYLIMTLVVILLACSTTFAQAIKNVVLVHGAFADGSGWRGIYNVLVKKAPPVQASRLNPNAGQRPADITK